MKLCMFQFSLYRLFCNGDEAVLPLIWCFIKLNVFQRKGHFILLFCLIFISKRAASLLDTFRSLLFPVNMV